MTINHKEANLGEFHEFSQRDVAKMMFLSTNTITRTEKVAIEKFKKALAEKGITAKDILGD